MSNESSRILQRAAQSITAAEALSKQRLYGFAVSRAYYAMFYTTEALLLARGLAFSKHGAVIAAFGKYFAKPKHLAPLYHRYLLEAFEKRQIGDYSFDEDMTPSDARSQIAHARTFLRTARAWLKRHAPSA